MSYFRTILSCLCKKSETPAQPDTSLNFSDEETELSGFFDKNDKRKALISQSSKYQVSMPLIHSNSPNSSQQVQDPYQMIHDDFMRELAQYRNIDFTSYTYSAKKEINKMIYGKYLRTMLMKPYNEYFIEETEAIFKSFTIKGREFIEFFAKEFSITDMNHLSNKNYQSNGFYGLYHIATYLHMEDLKDKKKINK